MNAKGRNRRVLAAAAVGIMVLAAVLGSTYAWNNYRQHKTNDANAGATFYKARLVEKYDPAKAENWKISDPAIEKQVRVKNPGKETPNDTRVYGDVYIRLQIKEFMELYPVTQEYSAYRYMADEDGNFISFDPNVRYTIAPDGSGDPVVTVGGGTLSGRDAAAAYASILENKYGGSPHVIEQVRMYDTPKHIDEYPADGVEDGVRDNDLPFYIRTQQGDPNGVYGDFIVTNQIVDRTAGSRSLVTGVINAKSDQTGRHQDDINTADTVGSTQTGNGECLYTPHQWQDGLYKWQPSPVGITGESFFDYVQWIYGSDVILLSQWDGQPVKKWIVDDSAENTEGWVYWGMYLKPEESTSNFLEQIQLVAQPDDAFYYAIHVDMQAVSYNELGRWMTPGDASGNNEIVTALQKAGMKVTAVTLSPENLTEVYFGHTQQFRAAVIGSVGIPQDVQWSLTGSGGGSFISDTGLLTVGTNETASSLTVTAASRIDPEKTASIKLNVAVKPVVSGISITSPAQPVALPKGSVQQFSAKVTGTNITQKVTWRVEGNTSAGTVINEHGVLTVGANETASAIRVVAQSVQNGISGEAATAAIAVAIL